MRRLSALVLLALLLAPAGVGAASMFPVSAAAVAGGSGSGTTNGGALADTLSTAAIDTGKTGGFATSELALIFAVTAGTTTQVDVQCKESADGTNYGWIAHCTDANPSTCAPQVLQFDVSSDTLHSFVVKNRARYVICQFDDTSDGTGTIVVRASKSAQ